MNEDELKKAMEQNSETTAKDSEEIVDGAKKLSDVTEKEIVSDEEKESEARERLNEEPKPDTSITDDGREKLRAIRKEQESRRQEEYIPSFEELVEAGALIPVPLRLNDDVRNSVNKVHNSQSYLARNREGAMKRRFPKQDLYSGRVTEISNAPIQFPQRTGYGEDRYVVVELDNGLSVYVPARQAGLTQPTALTQMRDQLKSVIITDIYDKSNISENGNDNELYAIGTIQSAEYQIGTALRSEFVNDPDNFLRYNRVGVISGIDRLHQVAIVTIDLTDQGSGYIDTKIPFDDLIKHYSFEQITDFPEFEIGSEIDFNFTNIYEREITDKNKNIKGTYFDIQCTRENMPDFGTKKYRARLLSAISRHSEIKAYLRSHTARNGVLVEVVPGYTLEANTSFRGVSRINYTRDDIRDHAVVYIQFDPRVHSIDDLKRIKRPVIVTGIRHSRNKASRQIAKNKGSYRGVSQQQYKAVADKYSVSSKKKTNNQLLREISNEMEKMINKKK